MKMKRRFCLLFMSLAVLLQLTQCKSNLSLDVGKNLTYCAGQASRTLAAIPGDSVMPRTIENGSTGWKFVPIEDWTSGFWPGTLWYLYEYTGDERWKTEADKFTRLLTPLSKRPAYDHDLGFQMFSSFGNGYRLTRNPAYKDIILRAADTLATLYDSRVGTIRSWPRMVQEKNWPHNTIIDNMINLELLFWAGKNGGDPTLYDIALHHAETTMKNHFRDDFSAYHVVLYDTITGAKIKAMTHQGYGDQTMWARGQAWAIYGYAMTYRETQDKRFLDFAQKVADVYLRRLPEDLIPYWDFDAPDLADQPRDASAAAITASGLLELSQVVEDQVKARRYRTLAEKMLIRLSSRKFQSRGRNRAFLLHATGHMPNKTEVDASIIYGDYYYVEALIRLKKLKEESR